jgi:osmotically-inducible protein OsmY
MDDAQPAQKLRFTSPSGRKGADEEIAKRALSLPRWKIRYNSIHVRAEDGHVTLSGEVDWYSDREAAEHTVRKLSGVLRVTNLITTTSPRIPQAHQRPLKVLHCTSAGALLCAEAPESTSGRAVSGPS